MKLSDKTKEVLYKAGWNEARRIDATEYINHLVDAGYDVNEFAADFIERFGGLFIERPNSFFPDKKDIISFDAIEAEEGIYLESVKKLEEEIGEKLVVIGEANRKFGFILVSSSGKFFSAFDDSLSLIGENLAQVLDVLCE